MQARTLIAASLLALGASTAVAQASGISTGVSGSSAGMISGGGKITTPLETNAAVPVLKPKPIVPVIGTKMVAPIPETKTVTPVAETKAVVPVPVIKISADAATSNPEPPKSAWKESDSTVRTAVNVLGASPAAEARPRVKAKKKKYSPQTWGFSSFGYGGYPRVRSY